ncbi:MAG: ATP-binding protein [Desulfuromonadales bacterium]
MFQRPIGKTVQQRICEPRRFIQVLSGPRQTGKTTLVRQVLDAVPLPAQYASADEPTLQGGVWIEQQWEIARLLTKADGVERREALLVLDEVQKIPRWSEQVKRLWDEDSAKGIPLKVMLLGSAPLLIQHGLTESLAGRFETIAATHWLYCEMRDAFGWDLETYIYYGGYPGAAPLIEERERWARYIIDSLIETTISRDILLMSRVDKPALLRRMFMLSCDYSGQILSFQKMLGQLHDAGNTTTIAHYLDLLTGAGMVTGLPKYSGNKIRQRSSSPKLQVFNTALQSAYSSQPLERLLQERDAWGRLVESAVGAHILNSSAGTGVAIRYWREGNHEVDFVLMRGETVVGIEVKSGRSRQSIPGMAAFMRAFPNHRSLLVGGQGIPLEEFFSTPVLEYL